MAPKIARISMVLLTVFIASIVLPDFFQTSFKRNTSYVRIRYSETTGKFLITGLKKDVAVDALGGEYSFEDLERMTPLASIAALVKRREFPDTICGVGVTPRMAQFYNYDHSVYLTEQGRYFGTMPLLHGGTDQVGVVSTDDYMRINNHGIQFYNCGQGVVDHIKSARFDLVLKGLGYAPPAKKLYDGASEKRDDGVFFSDSNDRLFMVRHYAYEPLCREIVLPEGMKIRKMKCVADHPEVIAYIFGDRNEVFILNVDHELIPLKLDGFDYDRIQAFEVRGNMFDRRVLISREGYQKLFVFDTNYRPIGEYEVHSDIYSESSAGKAERYIFPFVTSTYSYIRGYDINSAWAPVTKFIWVNLLLACALVFLKRRSGLNITNPFNIIDILIVCVFGIFGFVSVMIYPVRK